MKKRRGKERRRWRRWEVGRGKWKESEEGNGRGAKKEMEGLEKGRRK